MKLISAISIALLLSAAFMRVRADSDPAHSADLPASAVVSNYCQILHAGYEDSVKLARRLDEAINGFLMKPSSESLRGAREAWIRCRTFYVQTEIGRFYDGPIEEVESFINAWPIDENYIDYNADDSSAGIINQPKTFPKITADVILNSNEKGGEKNVSAGFHALEFLLWGQDLDEHGPGNRPHTDFVEGSSAPNVSRRREYLRTASALLVAHLETVEKEWNPTVTNNYRTRFVELPLDQALSKIFLGVGSLSGAELGGERLLTPYATKDQEDEHSCFSDTTHLDFINDQKGIQNVVLGRYLCEDGRQIKGPGLVALIAKRDSQLAGQLENQIQASLSALMSIPVPFDQAIGGLDSAPGRQAIKKCIDALQVQTVTLAKGVNAIGVRLLLK